jgi:hypothetical protein
MDYARRVLYTIKRHGFVFGNFIYFFVIISGEKIYISPVEIVVPFLSITIPVTWFYYFLTLGLQLFGNIYTYRWRHKGEEVIYRFWMRK